MGILSPMLSGSSKKKCVVWVLSSLKQRKRLVYQPVEHLLWTEKVLLAG